MPFAEEVKSYSDTRKRTSTDYVKFTPEYRVVLRILDNNARTVWKHWIPGANKGRGMGAICPNTTAQTKVCPIDASIAGLSKDDPVYQAQRARRRYITNVLDRTPYTVCPSCNEKTPGKKCQNCQADLKKADFVPLNKIKILEGGPRLFATTLNFVEQTGLDDWDKDITEYDITFQTKGTGRDREIAAIPQQPTELSDADFLDPETGEPQQRFDLDLLAEPSTVREIEILLEGGGVEEINAERGVA